MLKSATNLAKVVLKYIFSQLAYYRLSQLNGLQASEL